MTERLVAGFDFKNLREQRIKYYDKLTIDLSNARTNEFYTITGTYIYAIDGSDSLANIDIRLNEISNPSINFKNDFGVRAPFYRVYFTNTAQAGKSITLFFGREQEAFFELIRNASEISGDVDVNPQISDGVYGDLEQAQYYESMTLKNCFFGGCEINASSGKYSKFGLANPSGSGKNLLLWQFGILLGAHDSLADFKINYGDESTYSGGYCDLTTGCSQGNKFLGGAAASGEIRVGTDSTSGRGTDFARWQVRHDTSVNNKPMIVKLRRPIVIPPDMVIVMHFVVTNMGACGVFEWSEVDE